MNNICPYCKEIIPYKGTCTNCGFILYKEQKFMSSKNTIDRTYTKFRIYRTVAGNNRDAYKSNCKNIRRIMKTDRRFKRTDRNRIEFNGGLTNTGRTT